jgi:hypothetical protein
VRFGPTFALCGGTSGFTVVLGKKITKDLHPCLIPRHSLSEVQDKERKMPNDLPRLRDEIENRIIALTGRRLRNLNIVISPDGVTLKGQAQTFYIKQLAQQGVRQVSPSIRLENAIQVA